MIITFYKTDTKGRPWYYSVHDRQGHLFSEYSFTVVWGKNLNQGREKTLVFATRREMDIKIQSLLAQKIRQGYKVLYSFSRNQEYRILFDDAVERTSVLKTG